MKRERIILWIGITASAALMAALSIWKYQTFQMNGIDLAYFNQVFWNTVGGRPFGLSIHPHLSLGDHAEFFILILAPFYALLPRPETLLVLQSLALTLSAWPAHRITSRLLSPSFHSKGEGGRAGEEARVVRGSRRELRMIRGEESAGGPDILSGSEFPSNKHARPTNAWPLIFALAFAFSPFLQNAALYEFHILVFALPLLLFAADAYLASSFRRFILFLILALSVREDVALVTAAFGVIAAIDRRSWKWIIFPAAISAGWFVGSMKLISQFAVGGSYKFAAYYSWILDGVSLDELSRHFLTIPTLEFLLGILMPFLFLPLLRPKWLLLAALPAAQQMLTGQGAGALFFQMHYVVLILPGLLLATAEAVARWKYRLIPRSVLGVLFVATTAYSIITLGPLPAVARMIASGQPDPKLVAAKRDILSGVPADASTLASYDLLPALSSRENVYSLHYAYPGKTQFSVIDYTFPDPDEIIINQEDFLVFALNFPTLGWTKEHYASGDDRLRALLSRGYGLVDARGPILRFKKDSPKNIPLFQMSEIQNDPGGSNRYRLAPGIELISGSATPCPPGNDLCFSLSFEKENYEPEIVEPFLRLVLRDAEGATIREDLLPLGFGVYPPSSWLKQKTVTLTVPLIIPDDARPASVEIQLVRPEGLLAFSGVRSGYPLVTNLLPLGPAVSVPLEVQR